LGLTKWQVGEMTPSSKALAPILLLVTQDSFASHFLTGVAESTPYLIVAIF
jgi:hypothetical protein